MQRSWALARWPRLWGGLEMATRRGSFPSTYARLDTSTLLEVFAAGPERLDRALHGLDDEHLAAQPRRGDRWSARQIVAHLADAEIMGAARVRQILSQSGRECAFYDQEVWEEEVATVGGWITGLREGFPSVGDRTTLPGFELLVTEMDETRVTRLKLTRVTRE